MTDGDPGTDRELLEATWELYAEEFADHVGDVVTPDDHVDDEAAVDWGAQVFMFGFALGSLAGAHEADPATYPAEADLGRVEQVVEAVVDIGGDDDHPVSSVSVRRDFLDESR